MSDLFWKYFLYLEMKARIYKSKLRPILTYGAEARPENLITRRQTQVAETVSYTHLDVYKRQVLGCV